MAWPFEYLGSHIIRSTFQWGTELGNVFMGFHFNFLGSAKVSNFNNSIFANQNICTFEIAMDYRFLMQVIKSFEYLLTEFWSLMFGQWSMSLQVVFETSILNQFKDDLNFLIVRTDIEAMVFDDVWMIEFFQDGNFAF